ncbi:triose-phosphate isomerase [Candidatus Micrarchaeota archaeon]|nr:triose-phosphate isomerase [Candidatus Micrarchaeota archaeon]
MIVLNLKTYPPSIERSLFFTDVAREVVAETGVRIVICPPSPFLRDAADRFSDVFAQHCDGDPPGAFTGSVPADLLRFVRVKGSILNHSEKRLPRPVLLLAMNNLHRCGLESLVCAPTPMEMRDLASFSPTYLAVEPPELISSGISVSKVKPDVISNSVRAVEEINSRITVLCGAGVSDKTDVVKALELGAKGVLLSSAFVKSADPKSFLSDLAGAF